MTNRTRIAIVIAFLAIATAIAPAFAWTPTYLAPTVFSWQSIRSIQRAWSGWGGSSGGYNNQGTSNNPTSGSDR